MKKTIVYSDNTSEIVEDTPKHGVDYCDCCGDCLECQAEDECVGGGEHSWVVYTDVPKSNETITH